MKYVYSPVRNSVVPFSFSLSDSCKETRDNIISEDSIDEPCAVVMNKPTGHIFSFLHILSEVSLPAPGVTQHTININSFSHKSFFQVLTCAVQGFSLFIKDEIQYLIGYVLLVECFFKIIFYLPGHCEIVALHKHGGIWFVWIFPLKDITNFKCYTMEKLSCKKATLNKYKTPLKITE